jgi:hypothetical protein
VTHGERHVPTRAIAPAPVPAPEAVTLVPAPIEINGGRVLGSFDSYDGLCDVVRGRVAAMGITRLELDALSGNADGYSGKLLGPGQVKKFGKHSLERTLRGIGCKLVLVEDPEATTKIMARAEKRKRPLRQLKLLPAPSGSR